MIKPIKKCTIKEINEIISELNMPAFRAKQLLEWLYIHQITEYSQASNLPSKLVDYLETNYPLTTQKVIDKQISSDGTRKYLIQLHDNQLVETVGIPSYDSKKQEKKENPSRLTVCFSTQVGCPVSCIFCATGKESFNRNLGMGEIIEQIHLVGEDFNMRVSNLVAMGQGEPFLNTESVLDALFILNHKNSFFALCLKISQNFP